MKRTEFLKRLGTASIMVPVISSCSDDAVLSSPTLAGFTPTSGVEGTSVTIIGTNFSATAANNTVMFNGVVATVTSASVTQLTVVVPANASTGKISVTVNGGTATSTDDFTVEEEAESPTITSFTPTSAAVGSSIVITGTNFSSSITGNTVTINGTVATVTAATTTQLTVTVPTGASGTGKITVTTSGLMATSSADFTVTTAGSTAPTISSFTGSGAVGTAIVITGTNFSTTPANNTVTINGVTAVVTAATAIQLTVVVPAGATSGLIAVTVDGVTVTSSASFTVTSATCTSTNSETEGPFPTKDPSSLVRQNIVGDRTGVAFTITITIQNKNNGCNPLEDALVDIWHCDKDGYYSEYGGTSMQTVDYTAVHFLRGRQATDSNGQVGFVSIFPGWYQSRATHIHVHVYKANGTSLLVTQIAFPEGSSSAVVLVNAASSQGYTKGMSGYTYNASDNVFSDGVTSEMSSVVGSVDAGYALTHTIVVSA